MKKRIDGAGKASIPEFDSGSRNALHFQARNPRRIGILIITVWVVSLGISLAPQLGWKDPGYLNRISDGTCLVSQDPAYQVRTSPPRQIGINITLRYNPRKANMPRDFEDGDV